ncbi:MAG: tetratricopeptide repeat protein, partial [Flavobacteriales bacterium]
MNSWCHVISRSKCVLIILLWMISLAAFSQAKKGDRYMRAYAYQEARTAYEFAVMDNPEDVVSWQRLARCYQILRDSKRAEIAYNNCLILGDSSMQVLHGWYRAMLENADYYAAQVALDAHLAQHPKDTLSNYLRWGLANMDEYMMKMGSYDVSLVKGWDFEGSVISPVFDGEVLAFSTNQLSGHWVSRR